MRRHGVVVWAGLGVLLALAAACTGDEAAGDAGGIEPIEVTSDQDDAPDDGVDGEVAGEDEDSAAAEGSGSDGDEVTDGAADATDGTERGPFDFDDPSEIDEAYVDRVMAELFSVESAVLDYALSSNPEDPLPDDELGRLGSVLTGPRLLSAGEQMQRFATDLGVRSVFLDETERTGLRWETSTVAWAADDCVVAIGVNDVSGVAVEPFSDDEFAAVVLAPYPSGVQDSVARVNPTPWRTRDLQRLIYTDSSLPVPAEEFESIDFGLLLDLPCEIDQ